MKRITLLSLSVCMLVICGNAQHQLVKVWETDSLLKVPESIIWDNVNKVFYISNIDGESWERDGKGSVGRMTKDGKVLEVDWVSGLDAPKGMGLYGGKLYVADFENVVQIDLDSGKLEKKIPVQGAVGLNDLTIDPNGVIYVSDSRGKKLFKVENEQTTLIIDSLKGPNGVLFANGELYAVNGDGLYRVGSDKTLIPVSTGLTNGSLDGIVQVGDNFLVSVWQGTIWCVHKDGTKELLLDSREEKRNTADFWYDEEARMLYVPGFFTNTITAYEVK